MKRNDLPQHLLNILVELGENAKIVDVYRLFWSQHQKDLQQSGDLFYTWQYDIRWAATELRKAGDMKAADISPKGLWELAKSA